MENCLLAGPLIEEVSDDEAERLTSRSKRLVGADSNVAEAIIDEQPGLRKVDPVTTSMRPGPVLPSNPAFGDSLSALKQNPDMIRYGSKTRLKYFAGWTRYTEFTPLKLTPNFICLVSPSLSIFLDFLLSA